MAFSSQNHKSHSRSKTEVLVVGCAAADIMAETVDVIPEKGSSALFDRYEIHLGGNAANAAVCLAKLGMSAAICCKLGNDALGEYCNKVMQSAGVQLQGVSYSATLPTACSLVLVPQDGNRRILHAPGATASFGETDVEDALLASAPWLFVAGFFCLPGLDGNGLAKLLKRAKDHGFSTCLDCSVNHRISDWLAYAKPAFPHLDIIFPSEEEAHTLTGEKEPRQMLECFRRHGIPIAGVKLGTKGSAVSFENQYHELPAYRVEVVDTCGAGDAFMAGFLTALHNGTPPHEAARFGNAVGALCIGQLGATTGIPPIEKVAQFQKTTPTYY